MATPPKDPDAKTEPSPQLYVLRLDGGEPARITDAKHGVDAFAWRPDGRGFAYLARDDAPDDKRIKAHDDWFEITDNAWTSRSAPVPAHLWTIGADGKHAHRVTHGTWSLAGDPVFAPGARAVYVARTPSASTNHYRARGIVLVDLATGSVRNVTHGSTDGPDVAPGGKHLVYTGENPQAFSQSELFVSDLDGSHAARPDRAPRPQRAVRRVRAARPHRRRRERRHARPPVRAGARRHAARAPARRRRSRRRRDRRSHDGTLAFVGITPAHPPELYVLRENGHAPQRLTHYNDAVAAHAMGRTRTIAWRSADGYTADGVLTAPANAVAARKYPLVVLIHGGPTATSLEGFSSLAQLMAGARLVRLSAELPRQRQPRPPLGASDGAAHHERARARRPRRRRRGAEAGHRRRVAHRRLRLERRRAAHVVADRARPPLARRDVRRRGERLDRLRRHDRRARTSRRRSSARRPTPARSSARSTTRSRRSRTRPASRRRRSS